MDAEPMYLYAIGDLCAEAFQRTVVSLDESDNRSCSYVGQPDASAMGSVELDNFNVPHMIPLYISRVRSLRDSEL